MQSALIIAGIAVFIGLVLGFLFQKWVENTTKSGNIVLPKDSRRDMQLALLKSKYRK